MLDLSAAEASVELLAEGDVLFRDVLGEVGEAIVAFPFEGVAEDAEPGVEAVATEMSAADLGVLGTSCLSRPPQGSHEFLVDHCSRALGARNQPAGAVLPWPPTLLLRGVDVQQWRGERSEMVTAFKPKMWGYRRY
jgi:hypothetical protein